MNSVDKIGTDLEDLTTDDQVLNYWNTRQSRILETLKTADSNFEMSTNILHRLAKSFNNREKYSAVYHLYIAGFQPVENKLPQSDLLDELKFELGRGLHHNRKYDHSKRLFNELASAGFDTRRIDGWWDQTVYASIKDRIWIKTDVVPAIGRWGIMVAYVLVAIKAEEFFISTTVFIILFEIYESWWYKYRISNYLKDFEDPAITEIKKNIRKKILVELVISLLFYPMYFLRQDWLGPLILIIIVYFMVFHYGFNYYYLPKLIGDLNRKKHEAATSAVANAKANG